MNSLQKKTVFISCFLLISGLMAIDFFNPSLPYMLKDLQASQAEIKTLIVVYMGVLGIAQFVYGSYSDQIGRKNQFSFLLALHALAYYAQQWCTI